MKNRGQSISNADMQRLRTLVHAQAGINLGADKKTMLELRIRSRLRILEMDSFDDYCNYLFSRRGETDEMARFLDVVTTNKTDFFREPAHFNYLTKTALQQMNSDCGRVRPLSIWCAGCSTGEEAYTLAMVLSEYAHSHPGFRFNILATDLSTQVLEKANLAVYKAELTSPVPADLRRKYFVRSRDPKANLVRIVPELRDLIEFRRLNFMEKDYGLGIQADIIFCRNVIIYFDRATQEQVLRKITQYLVPGGHLFLGHSETLHGLDVLLTPVAPALYRKASRG